ncbi:MAG: 1-(5-phosphoribosyl)-5-[(5-phosphoribosylamino)methylideneamino]imidazole-4-carboxamide isomerase [Woeseiaceae bacterium]|nr:1-(5-phosphoribosyl)-5-[(5-phosphoribosylamino)methylideneamino]imidazole-4-carboxamide isomerase [Woeseiaceae bacterium]
MRIIPAIDIKGGKCVRLLQGRFDRVTQYSDDPAAVAQQFAALDVRDLHVVDLDGARTGQQSNVDAIRRIAAVTSFDIQLGGGLRDRSALEHWYDAGVSRAVVGSLAVRNAAVVRDWLAEFGSDRIVLALDVAIGDEDIPLLATEGWTRTSNTTLWECLDGYTSAGVKHVLCTDISRDGALAGPNVPLYTEILRRYPELQLQASGGIRDVADLRALDAHGIPAAISGRAMLDGAITADEVASFRRSA